MNWKLSSAVRSSRLAPLPADCIPTTARGGFVVPALPQRGLPNGVQSLLPRLRAKMYALRLWYSTSGAYGSRSMTSSIVKPAASKSP